MKSNASSFLHGILATAALLLAGSLHAEDAANWWNPEWTQRQPLTIDGSALSSPVANSPVLVRLHEGNFQFDSAAPDGSDLRFIAADGKTVLPHQIESFDSMMREAFVWLRAPEITPGAKPTLHVYFGNQGGAAAPSQTEVFDGDTAAVYHFAELGGNPADSTANGNHSETPATISQAAIIGKGLGLLGKTPVTIAASDSLEWTQGTPLTISFWIKPVSLPANALIASRSDGANSLRLLLDQGVPVVEITAGSAPVRSEAAAPLAEGTWSHLALVADGDALKWFVNGEPYTTTAVSIPALNSPLIIGGGDGETTNTTPFVGEIDEFRISNTARSADWIKFAAINQGNTQDAQRTLFLGEIEGDAAEESSHLMEHLSLFGDIAGNMMFDGWIAIGVCAIMIAVGWTVAIRKFLYLNAIEKGSQEFLNQWKLMSTDLTALDHGDKESVSSLGGKLSAEQQKLISNSPLYHIYHIGSDEIRNRLDKIDNRVEGLPGRSIQAIRASLDAGLVHESHRLTDGLVYLTISIAGGPYVGLLGTVVGVMITFAIIARSGEVNVNSIAPGIASALLATVVGLVVAIPALFIYSYLNGRIRNTLALMQVFIDEFVAKMAEFYRPPMDPETDSGKSSH